MITIGGSIQTSTVMCSFSNNEINIQSTDNDIECNFLNQNSSNGICFDDKSNTCLPSTDNSYRCKLYSNYLTCIGPSNIECSSIDMSCSIIDKQFYGNSQLLKSNQFVAKQTDWSSASSLSPFKLLLISLFTIVILLN